MQKKRPPINWTAVEQAMLRSFRGRATGADNQLCEDAFRRSPATYGRRNARVRHDEVNAIRSGRSVP